MKISVHFSREEFACQCGCGFDTVDAATLEALEAIRSHFGAPVVITSACRCDSHNKAIGGALNSTHKKGRACDIKVSKVSPSKVADYAESLGLSVGRYETFTHIDTRTNMARWDAT